ncbi:hypothetical protein [Microbacterium immunditiarum]|uniref:Uncharacterized protein n=1 Tax=Microbacterium immunditiarum TaxID=337480 RepID=A0A7Y9GNA7_9MICO|nr:hypothetical protein [Microbacterium immunditiarum]NYE19466.1 hypothetical protein [Microbacterium immunditiarum]
MADTAPKPKALLEDERSRRYLEQHPEIRSSAPSWAAEFELYYLNDAQPWAVTYSSKLVGGVTILQSAFHHLDGSLEFDPWMIEIGDDGTIRNSDDLQAVLDGLRSAVDLTRDERANRAHD